MRKGILAAFCVTGVVAIDTATANHFVKLVRAVALLGARCILSGVQPAVAATLVELGVELGGIQTSQTLRHAIRDGDAERAAIVQCYHNDLSHEEAAYVLGCPVGTVKTHVLRGKQKLKRALAAWAPSASE